MTALPNPFLNSGTSPSPAVPDTAGVAPQPPVAPAGTISVTRNFRAAISHADLVRQIAYDPATGNFLWRLNKGKGRAGQRAGNPTKKGYWEVHVNGVGYLAHRLAWFYQHGVWPKKLIDHRDRNPLNNSIGNLREATETQNLANKDARGFHEVASGSFEAMLGRKYLGTFPTAELASAAYQRAHAECYGEFSPHLVLNGAEIPA